MRPADGRPLRAGGGEHGRRTLASDDADAAGGQRAGAGRGVVSRADAGLTRRESDVLQLLAKGCSNREISRHLFLSEKTIKSCIALITTSLYRRARIELWSINVRDAGPTY